jgi:glycosyltransferase involved in cell wall biosynthesis
MVVAGSEANIEEKYNYHGVDVFRYPTSDERIEVIRGVSSHAGFDVYRKFLGSLKCDVYHQHSWTQGCGIHHLRFAKSLGIPLVATVHVPGFLCMRGTMMKYGVDGCEGPNDLKTCARCVAHAKGLNRSMTKSVNMIPMSLSQLPISAGISGKIASAVSIKSLTHLHNGHFKELVELSSRIIVLSAWMYDSMRVSGAAKNKLVLCRHGIEQAPYRKIARYKRKNDTLRIGFLGRADPIKGIERIVEAVKRLHQCPDLELLIYAIAGNELEEHYLEKLKNIACDDPRIHFEDAVSQTEVPRIMSGFDVLAVPSQGCETGPLTVLEALAAGTPVLGSNLGGIREYIQDGVNGYLLSPFQTDEWIHAIRELLDKPDKIDTYRKHIEEVRSMDDVASDMVQVYTEVIEENLADK